MASTTAFVKATTTNSVEGARGACPGGQVFTTVVTNIVTVETETGPARYVEQVTYTAPTAPVGQYFGQVIGRNWTPTYKG